MARLTEAQERAMMSALHGPLVIDPRGYLAYDGVDGSRHQWSPVHVCVKNQWMRKMERGPSFIHSSERVEITPAGRALLSERARGDGT